MAELKINISANVADANEGLSAVQLRAIQLEENIKKLQNTIANTSSQKKLTVALEALNDQQKELTRLNNLAGQSLSKIPQSAGQATATLTNFSRVVQDAPFGIIGIANNIDPLVTSFQQLKNTTGTTGGAITALLGTLTGPAGIALGVSTVTSLLVAFSGELFGSSKVANKAATENDRYSESIDNVVNKLKSERDAIAEVVSGQSDLSQRRQQNVRLSFGEGVDTDILLLKGQISITAKALSEYDDKIKEAFKTEKELSDRFNKRERGFKEILGVRVGQGDLLISEEDYNKELKKLVDERFKLQEDQLKAVDKLANQRVELKVLENKRLQLIDKDNKEQYEKYVDDTIKKAKELNDYFKGRIKPKFEISPFDTKEETFINAKTFIDRIQNGVTKVFNIGWNKSVRDIKEAELTPIELKNIKIVLLGGKIDSIKEQVDNAILKLNQELAKDTKFFQDKNLLIPSSLNPKAIEMLKKSLPKKKDFEFMGFENLTEDQKKLAETGQLIANTITPSLEAMIQAIGRGENAFQAFGNGVKAILVQVIQKLTATAILAGVLSALFPGGLGGSQGFGQIFGKLLGFRANGGPVTGNSPYIVGERGPELFVPNESGTIIPNNKVRQFTNESSNDSNLLELFNLNNITARALGGIVNFGNKYLVGERGSELFVPSVSGNILPNNSVGSFMGGRMSDIGGKNSVLRGQDIILAYARTQRSQLRVNG